MNRQDDLDCLEFDDHTILYDDVCPVREVEGYIVVHQRNHCFLPHSQAILLKRVHEARSIG